MTIETDNINNYKQSQPMNYIYNKRSIDNYTDIDAYLTTIYNETYIEKLVDILGPVYYRFKIYLNIYNKTGHYELNIIEHFNNENELISYILKLRREIKEVINKLNKCDFVTNREFTIFGNSFPLALIAHKRKNIFPNSGIYDDYIISTSDSTIMINDCILNLYIIALAKLAYRLKVGSKKLRKSLISIKSSENNDSYESINNHTDSV